MKEFKKKVISATLTLGMLTSMTPAVVFAAENHTAQLVMEATSDNGEFPKSGEHVKVSLYMQNAGWAQKDKGTGWGGGLISLTYDQSVLQYVDFVEEKIVSDVFDDITENHIDHGNTGEVLWMGMNQQLTNEVSFTNEKTKLAEIIFVVKDNLPENLDGVLEFGYPEKMDFQFGDLDKPNNQVPGIEDAVVTPVFHNNVKFDTTAPTITLDGSNQTTFHYSPVRVTINETNGIGSVTLDGEELSAPYAVSKSGTLVVKDKQGNTTTITVVIDDAAYLAAKTAIEKLPESISSNDEALVIAARKAVNAVTDQTAKSKLDIARLEKAEAALSSLQQEKAALVQEIAEAKLTVTLKKENVESIESLRAKVDALTAKGASFTTEELKNLTTAETAMAELQNRSQAAHTAIAKLPNAEETVWGDSQKLEQLKTEMEALKKLEDTFTAAEEAKLAEVEKGLQAITALKTTIEAEIQTVVDKDVSPQLATQVNAIKEKLNKLNEKGIPSSQVKGYDKFTAVADKVQDMLDKIDAVTKQINALPATEKIGFGDEKAINTAAKALKKLQAEKLDVTAEAKAKLTAAQQEIKELKDARAALVKEIADAQLTVNLSKESVTAIQTLRAKADALNARGAAFTAKELKGLTVAESELTALQKRSQDLHEAIAALPVADKVVWGNKEQLENIKKQLPELSKLGDVFTENELKKVTEVEGALNDIQTAADQLKAEMEALPDQADSNSANLLNALEKKIDALKNRGYTVDKSTMGQAAMNRYNTFKKAVKNWTAPTPSETPTQAPTQSPASTPHPTPIVQTGDTTSLLGLAGLAGLSGVTTFFIGKKRKKDL